MNGSAIKHIPTPRLSIAAFVLSCIAVAAFADPAKADGQRQTLLVLGDSLAAGSGVGKENAFPAFLQERINTEKLPFQVINAGVSGDTTSGGLRRINWLLRRPVDVLLLELGGNDGLRGIDPATTRSNLLAIVTRTRDRYPKVKIVIAGMQMPDNMGKDYTEQFKKIFPEVAAKTGSALIPFLLDGIAADPNYNLPDLIHPNREGHQIVAETVWKVLGPILKNNSPGNP